MNSQQSQFLYDEVAHQCTRLGQEFLQCKENTALIEWLCADCEWASPHEVQQFATIINTLNSFTKINTLKQANKDVARLCEGIKLRGLEDLCVWIADRCNETHNFNLFGLKMLVTLYHTCRSNHWLLQLTYINTALMMTECWHAPFAMREVEVNEYDWHYFLEGKAMGHPIYGRLARAHLAETFLMTQHITHQPLEVWRDCLASQLHYSYLLAGPHIMPHVKYSTSQEVISHTHSTELIELD